MALIKTSNPALGQNTFSSFAQSQYGGNLVGASARMTLSGAVNKTGILLLCAVATAAWTWSLFMQSHDLTTAGPLLVVGGIATLTAQGALAPNTNAAMAKDPMVEAGRRKLHANMSSVLGALHADRMKAHEIWSGVKFGGAA